MERVDKAISDCLGLHAPVKRIGEIFNRHTTYPLKDSPSEEGHYWELDGAEGVIIAPLPDRLLSG